MSTHHPCSLRAALTDPPTSIVWSVEGPHPMIARDVAASLDAPQRVGAYVAAA